MKLLTITIPCYNSEGYLKKCVSHALTGGDRVEIIIVDDGSTDKTPEMADKMAARYPDIIKVIHKENGGHGSAVNAGIDAATGLFFKVCDSDDWLDKKGMHKYLDILEDSLLGEEPLDCLFTNYVYEKVGKERKSVMAYRGAMPEDRLLSWDSVNLKLKKSQQILMHSVTYRTQLLKDCGLRLPEHTFYVDNIFVFEPALQIKHFMYSYINLYHWYIGREGQSVNEKTMIKRIDQQIFINKHIIDFFAAHKPENPQLYKYMLQYVDVMMCVTSALCIVDGSEELLTKKQEVWNYLKEADPKVYRQLRRTLFGITMNLPGKLGRKLSKAGYKFSQWLFGFN